MTVEFRLLGDVEVRIDHRLVEVGHVRQRCVLAALLVDANQTVPVDQVVDRVWGDRVPQRARNALSGYLSRLRRVLAGTADARIVRQPGGYLLAVDPLTVDLHRFHDLARRARSAGDATTAASLMDQALALWRGEAFATLDVPWINTVRDALAVQRLAVLLDRNDIALDRGEHAALLADLSAAVAAHPMDERLTGQLMLALYGCGRQAEALQHYEVIRLHLANDVGVDPGPTLQTLHKQILTADPALTTGAAPDRVEAAAAPERALVPRQLPASLRWFAGRDSELIALDAVLAESKEHPATAVISAVSGTAGVGKTALAIRWAHRVADRFPDGQLYVNLRGFDSSGSVMDPAEAVRGFLDALGVAPQRIPAGLAAQSGLYRSLLSGRRILVVLDNARDAEQVRPLLPGSPGCLAVVTSRVRLAGLVAANGAYPLMLDLLSPAESRDLLGRRLGPDRLAAEPDAVEEIIVRCARLPLALAIVAAQAATDPHASLATIAAELCDAQDGLDSFDLSDPAADVRTIFSWSYHALSAPAAILFRLLGLHLGPDICDVAAASLAGISPARIRLLLRELARANMLTRHTPGRYVFHDLLRTYAREQVYAVESAAERRTALHRVLDHYLHSAHAAAVLLAPNREPIVVDPRLPQVTAIEPADQQASLAWFAAEHANLMVAIDQALRDGFDSHAWQLPWTLNTYLDRQGHWSDWLHVHQTALTAARRLADLRYEAYAHRGLAHAYAALNQHDEATTHLQCALELYAQAGDQSGQAHMHASKTRLLALRGLHREAIDEMRLAMELFQSIGDRPGYAQALGNLGWLQVLVGDYPAAISASRDALDLFDELDDRFAQASAWDNLGRAHHHLDQHGQAVDCFRRALERLDGLGTRFENAQVHIHLGDTFDASGEPESAQAAWRAALDILDELGHPEAERLRARLPAHSLNR